MVVEEVMVGAEAGVDTMEAAIMAAAGAMVVEATMVELV
jgi:hypothetical protein